MALTRAQLLSGDIANGNILSGQPQGVRPGGAGIAFATNGIISVDASTIVGVMKLNNPGAYNSYVWPNGPGTAGQQLTTDGAGGVSWADSDNIPWTAKGQLLVGTGVGTDTILNPGSNTSILMAESGTTSGLIYSNSSTSAMLAPAGSTAQRPNPATAGQIRYNSQTGKFEFATGATTWEEVASGDPTVNGFVQQSIPSAPAGATGNALIPSGSTAQRQTSPAPVAGSTRFNTTTGQLEVYGNGGTWEAVPSSSSGTFVGQTIPTTGTPSAVIPVGNTAGRQSAPLPLQGYTRFNSDTTLMEVFDGTTWVPIGAPPNVGLGLNLSGVVPNQIIKAQMPIATVPPTPGTLANEAIDGSMYWDSTLGQLFIRYNDGITTQWVAAAPSGTSTILTAASLAEAAAGTINTKYSSPETAVPKTTAGMTGYAILPSSAVASTIVSELHYNTTSNHLEYGNGTVSKTVLEREGDNMTGKLSVTPNAIAAGVGGWSLLLGNYWTCGAIAFPLPTNLTNGQGGTILFTAAPASWPAAGGILKYPGGSAPAPASFPAVIPYYCDGTNVYLGKATEGIT